MSDEFTDLTAHTSQRITRAYARIVQWAFTRFYREFAWTYDTVAALVSGNRWRIWALAALPYLRGRVLELGCGTGNLQQALAQADFPAPIGLDASPQMLALTRRKLATGAAACLLRADARTLPFPLAVFDTLVATFPSEYIMAPATLAEARRVLRPGGRLVVVLAAQFTSDGLYQRAVDLAYRLTLQRPPRPTASSAAPGTQQMQPEIVAPPIGAALERELVRAGFAPQAFWHPVANSQVALVVAEAQGRNR
jgi:ubiquinone/menaquinone biosynthesis C-methylase UbiE